MLRDLGNENNKSREVYRLSTNTTHLSHGLKDPIKPPSPAIGCSPKVISQLG